MIQRFATNRTTITTKRERINAARVEVQARIATVPVFTDINRFSDPSPTRMVWMPSTTGTHPSFV